MLYITYFKIILKDRSVLIFNDTIEYTTVNNSAINNFDAMTPLYVQYNKKRINMTF